MKPDVEFVRNHFKIGDNPAIENVCSLDGYYIHGIMLKDLLAKEKVN